MQRQRIEDSTPVCRCRVRYLGWTNIRRRRLASSRDKLKVIQHPLRSLYPSPSHNRGWLSVWHNGVLMETIDDSYSTKVLRFFEPRLLLYGAAVRCVQLPAKSSTVDLICPQFLPLNGPFGGASNVDHPPLFVMLAKSLRNRKMVECHAFVCEGESSANALVRSCYRVFVTDRGCAKR